jgi:hypothetical protein
MRTNRVRRGGFGVLAGVLAAGGLAVVAAPAGAAPQTLFTSTGPGNVEDAAAVPAGVCFVTVTADGGEGGSTAAAGGFGALVTARVAVAPGVALDVMVAGEGGDGVAGEGGAGGAGGVGGGGGGGVDGSQTDGGGGAGGGASAVSAEGVPLVVVGGGGGAGFGSSGAQAGGAGGLVGADAQQGSNGGFGGTATGDGGAGTGVLAGGGGGVQSGGAFNGGGGTGTVGGGGGTSVASGGAGGTGTGAGGAGAGGAGNDSGGNGGAGGAGTGGGGGGGVGFGGGGGSSRGAGAGGGGYGGGGGGASGLFAGGGGGGSSFAAAGATGVASSADATGDGQVTISYDLDTDACPVEPVFQPDAMITVGRTGDGVYNGNGAGQSLARAVARGQATNWTVFVENDGTGTDDLTVAGPVAPAGFTVIYRLMVAVDGSTPRTDITAPVVAGTFTLADVPPGGEARLLVTVEVLAGATPSRSFAVPLTATSQADGTKSDMVTGTVIATAPGATFVSDLSPVSATSGYGPVEEDRSNGGLAAGDGNTITLNGAAYTKGLGVHSTSSVVYNLAGGYQSFLADVGVDDECGTAGSVVFRVFVDGVKRFDSATMTGASATKTVSVNTTGKNQLRLVVADAGDGRACDHADWAAARLS